MAWRKRAIDCTNALAWEAVDQQISSNCLITQYCIYSTSCDITEATSASAPFLQRTTGVCQSSHPSWITDDLWCCIIINIGYPFLHVCAIVCHTWLETRHNGRHFENDVYKLIVLYGKCRNLIPISLKLAPSGPIENKSHEPVRLQAIIWTTMV